MVVLDAADLVLLPVAYAIMNSNIPVNTDFFFLVEHLH